MKTGTQNISLWQLLNLLVLYEVGSMIVIGIGAKARQDSWIAVLIATVIGVGLIWMYNQVIRQGRGRDLFEIMEFLLGAKLSKVLILIYVFYFLYTSTFVIRDFGELIVSAVMVRTPMEVIALTLMLVTVYIIYLGIEVLARTAEVLSPYFVVFMVLLCVLLAASGSMKMNRLLPVLAEGWGPVLHAVFPVMIGFPFGEAVVFLLLLSRTTRPKHVARVSMIGIVITGLFLTYSTLIQVLVIGPSAVERLNFPILSAARDITIGNFIERVDALVVFITMLGIIVKAAVLLYASNLGLQRVFQVPPRSLLLPSGLLVSILSVVLSRHFGEFFTEGYTILPDVFEIPLQIGIPAVLLLALLWKNRRRSEEVVSHEDVA